MLIGNIFLAISDPTRQEYNSYQKLHVVVLMRRPTPWRDFPDIYRRPKPRMKMPLFPTSLKIIRQR